MTETEQSTPKKSNASEFVPRQEIERIWQQLTVVYGHRFLQLWVGLNTNTIKEDWREKLAGLSTEQINYALDHLLPGRPPEDALTFRRMALEMPDEQRLKLPPKRGPLGVPATIRPVVDQLLVPRVPQSDAVAWAQRYVELWGTAEKLTVLQKSELARAHKILAARGKSKATSAAPADPIAND